MISFLMAGSFVLKRLVGKKSTEWAETPLTQGPDSEMGGVSDRQTDSTEESLSDGEKKNQKLEVFSEMSCLVNKLNELDQDLCEARRDWKRKMKVSLAEVKRKYDAAMQSNAQLESQNSDLMSQVETLRGAVQQLEEELSETRRNCNEIKRVSLAEAERKYEQLRKTNAQLEKEMSDLQERLQEKSSLLPEICKKCAEEKKEDDITNDTFVKVKARKRENCLLQQMESLKAALAEAEHNFKEEMENSFQLRRAHRKLINNCKVMRNNMSSLEEQLDETRINLEETQTELEKTWTELVETQRELAETQSALVETRRRCNEETKGHEQELEGHSARTSQYDQMKGNKSQKDALAEAEQKYEEVKMQREEVMERLTRMSISMKTDDGKERLLALFPQVNEFRENIKSVYEKKRIALYTLKEQYTVMTEQYIKLLNERKQEWEAQSALKSQYDQMKEQLENESMKDALPEAEKKFQEVAEILVQLESEHIGLMEDFNIVSETACSLERQLAATWTELEETQKEPEKTRKELEKTLKELEKKQTELKRVKSELEHAEVEVDFTAEDLEKTQAELEETQRRCFRETKEKVRIKKEKINQANTWNMLMKDMEMECALQTRACYNLRQENAKIRRGYNKLFNHLKEQNAMMNEQFDKLLNEHKQEREAHSVLKSQYSQMKEQLENESSKELEKESQTHNSLKEHNTMMKKQYDKLLNAALYEAEQKNKELKTQHEEVLKRITKLNSEHLNLICKFTSEQHCLQQRLTETQTELKMTETQLKETQTERQRTKTELEETQTKLNDTQTELEETKRRCIEETSEKQKIMQQNMDNKLNFETIIKLKEKAFEEESQAHNALKEENTMMKEQYDKLLKDALAEAEQKYEELQKQHKELVEAKSKLESEHFDLICNAISEVHFLEQQLYETQSELEATKTQLNNTQTELNYTLTELEKRQKRFNEEPAHRE